MIDQDSPWSAYAPSAADPWDRRKVAHLHRRAGFGATRDELERDLSDGPAASVDRFLRPRPPTDDEQEVGAGLRQGVLDAQDLDRLKAWWLYRMLFDPDPLREKLTLFWHGHFATSNRKVQSVNFMLRQNELLRRDAPGNFAALLTGIAVDPAMLIWLDGGDSRKEKPNENFAREFLELFTLGIGHYIETDVRAAARAFTGWERRYGGHVFSEPTFRYHSDRFDGGVKTFLGQTGPWKPEHIVRITLAQPAAAEFLCRKLYRFFVSETAEPAPEVIQPLAEELRRSGYAISRVVEIILRSRHFYSPAALGQRVKSPVEFTIGLLRGLEVPRGDVRLLAAARACDRQGQELFDPPSVKGWDGGRSWINSSTVLERGNWIADVVWGNADLGLSAYDPLAWMRRHHLSGDGALAAYLEVLLEDTLTDRARSRIRRVGQAASADALRKAVQLALNCPEYQVA
jgi:uncharacterized protein (DUF1800 family)